MEQLWVPSCTDTLTWMRRNLPVCPGTSPESSLKPRLGHWWELHPQAERKMRTLCSTHQLFSSLYPSRLTATTVLLDEMSFYFSTSHFLFCNYCQEVFTENMVDFWQPVMWERDELFLCAALGLKSGQGGGVGVGVQGKGFLATVKRNSKTTGYRAAAGCPLWGSPRNDASTLKHKWLVGFANSIKCLHWDFHNFRIIIVKHVKVIEMFKRV